MLVSDQVLAQSSRKDALACGASLRANESVP
jgi:hypothetical protein